MIGIDTHIYIVTWWIHGTQKARNRARTYTRSYHNPTSVAPLSEIRQICAHRHQPRTSNSISEAMPRACCRRLVLPPPLPAHLCNAAAAAPIVIRRGRNARCRLLSRTTSESAWAKPSEADGAIAHVDRFKNRHLLYRERSTRTGKCRSVCRGCVRRFGVPSECVCEPEAALQPLHQVVSRS